MPDFYQVMLDYTGAVHHQSPIDLRSISIASTTWNELIAIFRQLIGRELDRFEIPIRAHNYAPRPLTIKWSRFRAHSIAEFSYDEQCVARSFMLPGLDTIIEIAAIEAIKGLIDTYCSANNIASQFSPAAYVLRPVVIGHVYGWEGQFEDIWSGTSQICLAAAYFESVGVIAALDEKA